MAAAWYRAKGELRRRWRTTLLLALLVGVAGGAVLTTVAGARRSSTAYERLGEETFASHMDVALADTSVEPAAGIDEVGDAARALPQVVGLERNDYPFIVPAGSGFYPYLDFLAAAALDADSWLRDVDRPRVLEGTVPNAEDADRIAISSTYADESGLGVGDRVEFESYAWPQMEALFTTGDAGPPAGPKVTLVVSGVFDAPIFLSESTGDFQPRVFLTPAFLEEHGDEIATYEGGFTLRLRGGAADVDDVTASLRETFGDATPLEITPASEIDRKIEASIDVIVTALALCALVAALAGAVAVGQALTRHFASQESSDRWLAALGMTRWERVVTKTATVLPVAALGALLAAAFSVLASPLMPVGVARRAEPDPGLDVDGPVLLLGFLVVFVAVVLLSLLAAAVVSRRERFADGPPASTPSRWLGVLRSSSLEPPATIGVGMALEPRGGTTWAVRSAFLGVAFGVMGLVAVSVFVASVDELVNSPERYGSPFDAAVSGFSGNPLEEGDGELLDDQRVAAAGLAYGGLSSVAGEEVNTFALESLKGEMYLTMLDGHRPLGRLEVVLGTATLDAAGVELGDEVEIKGATDSIRATVVGTAVFPVVDERSGPDRGALVGTEDLELIVDPEELNADVLIDWADDVDPSAANEELAAATGTEVFGPRLPSDVNNLSEVKALPRALAAFLAVLAALAVIHALMSTVRMRRQDLAVLRTLGFQRRQLGSTLVWQATTIGVVGLVLGVPLGLLTGRVVWRAIAGGIGVVDDPVTPVLAVVVVVVAVFVILALTAILPSRAARRVSPAAVLRSG